MLKKIIFALVAIRCILGCAPLSTTDIRTDESGTNTVLQVNFNEETYVWEEFNFPTNRTSGVQ